MLTHLRRNAVAYLALFVALGGTSYAAVALPKNSVGAAQIKPNAVSTKKVKNGSLRASDFKSGDLPAGPQGATGPVGPVGPVYGSADEGSDTEPRAIPQGAGEHAHQFTLPAAGPTYISFEQADRRRNCTSGNPFAGLYVDGKPVPGGGTSLFTVSADPTPAAMVGIINLAAGPHTVDVRDDCPAGSLAAGFAPNRYTWTVLLLGSAG